MSTIPPTPFPQTGLRALSPREVMQRTRAQNCTVRLHNTPSCIGQLNVGIFFDGTGNNMKLDLEDCLPGARKHSNVVKLFRAYTANEDDGYFRYYIPGVGTPFPTIGEKEGSMLGGPFAWDGENRITWAFTRLLNAPHQYVVRSLLLPDNEAATIANTLASTGSSAWQRRTVLHYWQRQLAHLLKGRKPEISVINLSVFGFSRGAAEARAFCNWLFEVCENKDGGWIFAGIPIRIPFLGIFDTVASVGVPNTLPGGPMEGHQSWADNNLTIHPGIEQCVHFVAGHEVRASFPLDSVRSNNSYPANAKEVMYPGAHSDLGGGYAPNALGIAAIANEAVSIIPAAQMYQEALLGGVPLVPWGRLPPEMQADLTAAPKTIGDFNTYLAQAKIGVGPVEEVHKKHMSLYFAYRIKYRNAIERTPFYIRASVKDRGYLRITTDTIHKCLSRFGAYALSSSDENYDVVEAARTQRRMMTAAGLAELEKQGGGQMRELYSIADSVEKAKLTPAIEEFFGNYVHDSMAGFIDMGGRATNEFLVNGYGIMRFRKIFTGDD